MTSKCHKFVEYVGLNDIYKHCEYCGLKESEYDVITQSPKTYSPEHATNGKPSGIDVSFMFKAADALITKRKGYTQVSTGDVSTLIQYLPPPPVLDTYRYILSAVSTNSSDTEEPSVENKVHGGEITSVNRQTREITFKLDEDDDIDDCNIGQEFWFKWD